MSEGVSCAPASQFVASLPSRSVQLVWTDPPFGTGATQTLKSTGCSYRDVTDPVRLLAELDFERVLTSTGVLVVCLDYRNVHQAVVALTETLRFHGEIVWHAELGATSKALVEQQAQHARHVLHWGDTAVRSSRRPDPAPKDSPYGDLGDRKRSPRCGI